MSTETTATTGCSNYRAFAAGVEHMQRNIDGMGWDASFSEFRDRRPPGGKGPATIAGFWFERGEQRALEQAAGL